MKRVCTAAVLLSLVLSVNGFAQSINSSIGGTVQDATGAFIPGVTITATNTNTGVAATTISNEAGAYQFPSLQLGTYDLNAELPGFQTQVVRGYQLGSSAQARVNFTMQVGSVATAVEVTIAADALLTTSSNSVGTVLPEYKVRDLPVSTRNIINLVELTPGVVNRSNMAGAGAGAVNATRDGINVNDGRYENGAWSVVYSSPDLVEEVKVLVAPVDAETSRGSGQVSMATRSGTNAYRGSLFWVNHNSVLDANDWFDNYNGVSKSYDNRNQYGGRLGGPIIRNKTFFFALFEGQRDMKRNETAGTTLTDMAKAGIFRYFPGADNANANNANPTVDRAGNPVRPAAATGDLRAIDLFGNCTFRGAPVANCQTYRDPLRSSISTIPYMLETFKRMPSPNQFTGGDGLNTAQIAFVRRQDGLDATNGNSDEINRDQYNLRIDHNFNSNHKLSLIGTHEKTWGTASQAGLREWPDALDGLAVKRPYLYTIQMTSTLSNSLLNQIRLGKRASNNWQWGSADRGDEIGAYARTLLHSANGIPVNISPGMWTTFVSRSGFGRWREGINPMKSIADDLSWNTGKHSFKGGFEWRRQESKGFNSPNYIPVVTLGAGAANPVNGLEAPTYPGLTSNAAGTARSMVTSLSGSVSQINQAFGVVSSKDTRLVGYPSITNNVHHNFQAEISTFFKDEWKFSPRLTLNLGVHWEYYGQTYEADGLAARIIGGEDAFTNVTCTSSPGTINFTSTCSNLVQVQFVGKNSPNPDIGVNLKGNDLNNFAPAIGFSYNVPWFGQDKTVLRAGYGINYQGAARNFIGVDSDTNTVPGITLVASGAGLNYQPATYTNLDNMTLPIPFPTGTPTTSPFVTPTTARSLGIQVYSRVSPYIQNWNLEVQREVARNTTIEVRYIGSKGTKQWGSVDVNDIEGLGRNRALFDAFVAARSGRDSALLDQMLMGLNLQGTGAQTVNGTTWTGAMAVRTNTTTRAQLANGNVGTFINALNTTLTTGTGSSDRGAILRRAGFAENFIVPSPQYSSAEIAGNHGNTKYHALQMQFSRRLSAGFTNTTTWTWSKAMSGAGTIDPQRRNMHSMLQGADRKTQLNSNGSYELPFGTGRRLLANAPGWVDHIVGGWQLSGIMSYNSGAPLSITSNIATIGTASARPIVVGEIPEDMGKVVKVANGVRYFEGFTQITDPGINSITTLNNMATAYNNRAIVAPNGQIILVNPQPGELGTLAPNTLRSPGSIRFDANMVKRFRIHETKEVELRLDAINLLNTPNFGAPSSGINGNNNFGNITSASGARSFITNLRFNF